MVEIKKNLVSESKYNIKCPYEMEAEFVVVHNTANDAPAENEIAYMIRNDNEISYHYAIDDICIVQGVPTNRNTWNAGDGAYGDGNRKGIAIEICYSMSGGDRFIKAEQNAAEFIASILKEKGWGIDKVKKHQDFSNKYCPHRTLDMGWDRFLDMIKSYLNDDTEPKEESGAITPEEPKTAHSVGEKVKYNKIYVSSTSEEGLNPAITEGTITYIAYGTRNPYLINENTGWVNDECIINEKPSEPVSKVQKLYLPSDAESWRVYSLGVAPTVGNECGFLKPSLFGGLTYDILGWSMDNVAIIETRDFGKVQIFVAPETGAIIK